jgi:hypothetical protein
MYAPINKKKIFVLVFSTFLSILFIFLSYYGYTRYISMYNNYFENYILNYRNLPKKNDHNIIISISSCQKNIKKLRPLLKSLLDQTVKVDKIILNLPPSEIKYDIPEYYYKVISIYHSGINYYKCMNSIPTLLRETENNSIIILLRDDLIYGKDYI